MCTCVCTVYNIYEMHMYTTKLPLVLYGKASTVPIHTYDNNNNDSLMENVWATSLQYTVERIVTFDCTCTVYNQRVPIFNTRSPGRRQYNIQTVVCEFGVEFITSVYVQPATIMASWRLFRVSVPMEVKFGRSQRETMFRRDMLDFNSPRWCL